MKKHITHNLCLTLIPAIAAIALLAFMGSAYSATIEVHPGGSIQNAVNQASSGDTVYVFSGVYPENIVMKNGVNVTGISSDQVILKGNVLFKDAACALKDITVLFPEGNFMSYSNSHYSDFKLEANAGITVINSAPVIQKCVIKPDLELINTNHPDDPQLEYYGAAIQLWSMYNNPETAPIIEANLIQNTNNGIYYFSQAFGGAISGEIKNNTFYHNKTGIALRMHKENPHIYNNIFDNCEDSAVFFTYEDGALLVQRKASINNNLFYENTRNFSLGSSTSPFDLIGIQGNIEADPLFIDPANDSFYLQVGSPCTNMGQAGEKIGSYPTDLEYPTITNILPVEKKFIGQSGISISGTVHDDNGILSVYVNSEPAVVNGATFSADNFPLDYGLNDIAITAKDLAQKDTTASKAIYNFRLPVAPPGE